MLARRVDVRAYGLLLLNVGRRASTSPRLIAAAAFSEPSSFLEERIRMMTSPRPRWALPRAMGLGAAALVFVATACRAPEPAAAPRPSATMTMDHVAADAVTLQETPREAVERLYPQIVRGVNDTLTIVLFYSPEGKLEDYRVTIGGKPTNAPVPGPEHFPARLGMERYAAGELGPNPVKVFTVRELSPEEIASSAGNPTDPVLVTTVATTARAPGAAETVRTAAGEAAPAAETVVTTTVPVQAGAAAPVSIARTVPVEAGAAVPVSVARTVPVGAGAAAPVSVIRTVPVEAAASTPVSVTRTVPVAPTRAAEAPTVTRTTPVPARP